MSMRARKVEVGVSLPLRFTLDPSLFPLLFFPQQVFFVVPRINQIEEAWQQISRCVPDARVAVGHSKVSEMTFLSGAQLFAHGRPAMLMGPGLGRCVAREDAERPLAPLLNFFATQTITIAGKKSGRRGSAVHAGLLLATSIIENGIDMPNVNSIVVMVRQASLGLFLLSCLLCLSCICVDA